MKSKAKRYSASAGCVKCKADIPLTADEGSHSVECFKCGTVNHIFLGDASKQLKPTNLKEA